MECPYCKKELTFVKNSRSTRGKTQIWRRRLCSNCGETFTTYEIVDLSHLVVIKKSGIHERFSRIKLYPGIYGATIGSKTPNRERLVDKITRKVEKEILHLRKKQITSEQIGSIVLRKLKKRNIATFLRFLAYHKNIKSEAQMKRELA